MTNPRNAGRVTWPGSCRVSWSCSLRCVAALRLGHHCLLGVGPLCEAPPLAPAEARLGMRRVGVEISAAALIQTVVMVAAAVVYGVLVTGLRHKFPGRREDEEQREPLGSGAGQAPEQ